MRFTLQTRALWQTASLIVLALLPIIYLITLVQRNGVNVPYADEFSLVPFVVKAHNQGVTLSDLFAQHNEHRYFFPRLLIISFARLAGADVRAQMFFSVLLTGLVSLNLWWLVRKTLLTSVRHPIVLLFLINLLLFSPVQAENWTWGFQFPLFLCNFLFSCGLVAAVSGLPLGSKFALCLALALVATFSFGGGVLLWGLTFPLALLWQCEMTWKRRLAWAVPWGAAALGAMALYFFHYVKPAGHPRIAASVNPLDYFSYVTTFLGAHLSRASRDEPFFQAAAAGTVLLAIWCAGAAYAFRYRSDSGLTKRLLPWLALGAYAILNASLAAMARIGFGVGQALDSRYTSFSLYLGVAAIGLVAILRQDVRSRRKTEYSERAAVRLEAILVTAFALCWLIAFSWGRTSMMESQRTRLWGKGALLFSNVIDSGELHDRFLMASAPDARAYANLLDGIGLLRPHMIQSAEISKLNAKGKEAGEAGYLDIVSRSGSLCSVTGWAVLPRTRTPAHCVVLSYDDPVRGAIAFRVADEIQRRSDVADILHSAPAEMSGWICHFDRTRLPAGDLMLRAWAFDANRAILYPLGTPQVLR